jgi:hypothetical protein
VRNFSPYWEAERGNAQVRSRPADPLLDSTLLSNYIKIRLASARVERRISLLRAVEGLWIYAAEHDGKLPAALSDCTVPLPLDPMLGKPFQYSVDGDSGTLLAPPPPGAAYTPDPRWKNPHDLRYVVKITK